MYAFCGHSFVWQLIEYAGQMEGCGNRWRIADDWKTWNPSFGPTVALAGLLAQAVERSGNQLVGQHAGQIADQRSRLSIGGPPVLAGAVAGHHQMRVAAALPVQQQVNLAALDRRDDLHQHCPKETLAQLRRRALMTPDPLQVLAQGAR